MRQCPADPAHCHAAAPLPAFKIVGSLNRVADGTYTQTTSKCNGKHVYQRPGSHVGDSKRGGEVLYQPSGKNVWMVGGSAEKTGCRWTHGTAHVWSGEDCAASPDACTHNKWIVYDFEQEQWVPSPALRVQRAGPPPPSGGVRCNPETTPAQKCPGGSVCPRCALAHRWPVGDPHGHCTCPPPAGQGQLTARNIGAHGLPICDLKKEGHHAVQLSSFVRVPPRNEDQLLAAVRRSPVSVVIDASESIQLYKGGVVTSGCSSTKYNHAVLVVGFGTERGIDYWLVKNSWGENWGDEGYVKIERGANVSSGRCGIALQPVYPIAK
jgi:hypothetical protein